MRIIVGTLILIYLVYTILRDGNFATNDTYTLVTALVFFISAFSIIVWLVIESGINVARRIIGIITDCSATTAAPLFVLYLSITFGNGFSTLLQ